MIDLMNVDQSWISLMRIEWVPLGIKTLQSASCSQASKQGRDVVVEGGHILVPGQVQWKR